MPRFHFLLLIIPFLLAATIAYSQQDVEFHENAYLLAGKNILKVKRNFHDPYLWVLAENNEVYRINSLDNSIADYTALFNNYNLPFIDIAGQNKDVVFIATNSNYIIQYKNGSVKLIGTAQGIEGIVNSIGIIEEMGQYATPYFPAAPGILIIGTSNTIYNYNIANETAAAQFTDNVDKPGRVYDATYRSALQTFNSSLNDDLPGLRHYSILTNNYLMSFLWTGGLYGEDIYTATQTTGIVYNYIDLSAYQTLFYGTEKGLVEMIKGNSHIFSQSKQYLQGTKVNKVATIYGLTTFGNAGLFFGVGQIKENLLVGTDKGLYFSNSFYNTFGKLPVGESLDFLSYAPLENIVINDISVNNVVGSNPLCEDGAWVATQKGLYYLRPDYGNFLGTQRLQALIFENDYAGAITEKETCGTNVKMTISEFDYKGNTIQWYKNGVELPGITSRSFETNESGEYYAVVYDPCGMEHIQTNQLKVKAIDRPSFKFDYNDKLQYCENAMANLQVEGSDAYQYRWYKDGVLTGQTGKLLTLNAAGKYKVEVSACTDNWETSKEVIVEFIKLPKPVITTNKTNYCIGDAAILNANIQTDAAYTLNWIRDNVLLPDVKNKTNITVTEPGNYAFTVSSTQINCSQTAQPVAVVFAAPPTLSIQKVINTTLCDGESVSLKATYSAGNISWSTGANTDNIEVKTSGNYTARATSGDCFAEQTMAVQFLPNPILAVPDAALCQFTKEAITLSAPTGFSKYEWNGVAGGSTYTATSTGDITLVVTDANGCRASQTIKISSYCTDIKLANTFTPNGDGVNDTWIVEGLDGDPTAMVKIYNRYGTPVFEKRGGTIAWNGTTKGKPVPAGAYYYVISARGGKQILSGSVTVIY
ncbi:T9SS type B sorting domain-containing protein [Mucilaginibacter pedocola]|uniref:Ig-like domain-containing protein n=1 Tax=Mucilaginibacter pedocola TaxID=1792845 RepID=A0A1S9P7G4_9SPHI|nr:gliding motility-associated C-terminal domain-containing protein [Mucilaginibacter pedocola]OOQ56895.1 hypothetical protein BC343_18125 [Mucilaginibacter pedocola]